MPARSTSQAKKPANTQPQPAPGAEAGNNFLKGLDYPLKAEVATLRKMILKADPRILEGIEWNTPSFHCGDWFATFHLRSNDFAK